MKLATFMISCGLWTSIGTVKAEKLSKYERAVWFICTGIQLIKAGLLQISFLHRLQGLQVMIVRSRISLLPSSPWERQEVLVDVLLPSLHWLYLQWIICILFRLSKFTRNSAMLWKNWQEVKAIQGHRLQCNSSQCFWQRNSNESFNDGLWVYFGLILKEYNSQYLVGVALWN